MFTASDIPAEPHILAEPRPIPHGLVVNKSSEARDHCANERTFLSYLRLTLTFWGTLHIHCEVSAVILKRGVVFGLVLLKSHSVRLKWNVETASTLLTMSIILFTFGTWRYFKTHRFYDPIFKIVLSVVVLLVLGLLLIFIFALIPAHL